jgi:ATPase subunit of ABC transporter with duplicated ATPase domains
LLRCSLSLPISSDDACTFLREKESSFKEFERQREEERELEKERERVHELEKERARMAEMIQSDRRRPSHSDALSYVLRTASPVRRSPARPRFDTVASSSSHAAASSTASSIASYASRPLSKVDERLRKIQQTFASLKSDKF